MAVVVAIEGSEVLVFSLNNRSASSLLTFFSLQSLLWRSVRKNDDEVLVTLREVEFEDSCPR